MFVAHSLRTGRGSAGSVIDRDTATASRAWRGSPRRAFAQFARVGVPRADVFHLQVLQLAIDVEAVRLHRTHSNTTRAQPSARAVCVSVPLPGSEEQRARRCPLAPAHTPHPPQPLQHRKTNTHTHTHTHTRTILSPPPPPYPPPPPRPPPPPCPCSPLSPRSDQVPQAGLDPCTPRRTH
jgi:hypothetical protein